MLSGTTGVRDPGRDDREGDGLAEPGPGGIDPLVFPDAIRGKTRDEGLVRNKAIHVAVGVRADGAKEVLGLRTEQNEGAKFWLRVLTELKNRGVEDIPLAVVDGLTGFPEGIAAATRRPASASYRLRSDRGINASRSQTPSFGNARSL